MLKLREKQGKLWCMKQIFVEPYNSFKLNGAVDITCDQPFQESKF